MKQKKIIVCDAIHEKGFEILRAEKDIEVVDAVHLPKDELLKIIGDCIGLELTKSACLFLFAKFVFGLDIKPDTFIQVISKSISTRQL